MNSGSNGSNSANNIGCIEAAIWADSAVIDRETGRVIWEGGTANTLWESVTPKFGAEHFQATLISVVLSLAFLGILASWIQQFIASASHVSGQPKPTLFQVLNFLIWPLLILPKIENRWLVSACVLLYALESYNCSTRRFLSNTITSLEDLDDYLEKLRQEPPIVTWNFKTFHYEYRRIFMLPRLLGSMIRSVTPSKQGAVSTDPQVSSTLEYTMKRNLRHTAPKSLLTRKVLTNDASATYQFASCRDDTVVGVWTRAQAFEANAAPLTKIALTQLLILTDGKAREDYFQQQSSFVASNSNSNSDEFSQFSTDFHVASLRPRVLVVRPKQKASKLFQLKMFWAFTILGLTVPYRIWFDRYSDFVRVTTIKETSASAKAKVKGWTTSARGSQVSTVNGNVGGTIFGEH